MIAWKDDARTYMRGHLIVWRNSAWVYADDGTPADDSRPCVRCGRMPTPEGHDACLGHIDGATGVCCGHGIEEGYIYTVLPKLLNQTPQLDPTVKRGDIDKAKE